MDQSKQEKELRKQYNPKDWGDSIYLMRPDGESEKINMKKMKGEKREKSKTVGKGIEGWEFGKKLGLTLALPRYANGDE